MTTEGRRLGSDISELVAVKDTFVQPYDTAQEQLSAQASHIPTLPLWEQ